MSALAEFISFNGHWHKKCCRCQTEFGATDSKEGLIVFFNRNKAKKDGLDPTCKQCRKKIDAVRPLNGKINVNRKRHPIKYKARAALNNALASGKIKKPKECSKCSASNVIIHGHHSDYKRPLDVIWVCPECHAGYHREVAT